jgi:hypothetical protein
VRQVARTGRATLTAAIPRSANRSAVCSTIRSRLARPRLVIGSPGMRPMLAVDCTGQSSAPPLGCPCRVVEPRTGLSSKEGIVRLAHDARCGPQIAHKSAFWWLPHTFPTS